MPELPEVETVMRGLEPFLTGAIITKAQKNRPNLRIPFPANIESNLKGRMITRLSRRAKYIFIHLKGDDILVVHLGMSGSVSIIEKGGRYKSQAHDHFLFHLKSGVQIVYNDPRRFGMVFMITENEYTSHKYFAHLGPEPLGNNFSAPILCERLKGKQTSIKQALLDQRVVVGVGNIYACEALYKAGISPTKKAGTIKGDKAQLLVQAIRDVLKRAIKAGGSTLKDYKHADGSLGYFQHQFTVYGREKEACPDCNCDIEKTGGIKRIVQSGRSTFYCPRQQN